MRDAGEFARRKGQGQKTPTLRSVPEKKRRIRFKTIRKRGIKTRSDLRDRGI